MVLGMGMTARARKRYTYNVTERDLSGVDIIYNKGNITSVISDEDNLEDAYRRINEKLGINILRLFYIPKDMYFQKLTIDKNKAKLWFNYKDRMIYVTQELRLEGSSYNPISDRKPYKNVYNNFLNCEIPIEMNDLTNGEKEFHIRITIQDSIFSIEGILEEKEFEKIVENIYIMNNEQRGEIDEAK
ncbi:MAG: hypothetical protein SPF91_01435, partial [Clostridium sp.]|nr:hypothetical protein [Clostridium sp.]